MSNCPIKKIKDGSRPNISNSAAKINFIALKAKIDKLDINKLVNIPTCLNFSAWRSKNCLTKSIKPPSASNSLIPALNYISTKPQVKFDGSCFKSHLHIHKHVVNIYIVYVVNL